MGAVISTKSPSTSNSDLPSILFTSWIKDQYVDKVLLIADKSYVMEMEELQLQVKVWNWENSVC